MEAVAGTRASPWLNDFYAEDPATLGQVVGGERIGAKGAQRLLSVARNENTARKYERNYIEPYGYFPFVPLLAELYDDLQPGARFQHGMMARSDGRGPTVPPHGTSAAWPPGDQHVVRC